MDTSEVTQLHHTFQSPEPSKLYVDDPEFFADVNRVFDEYHEYSPYEYKLFLETIATKPTLDNIKNKYYQIPTLFEYKYKIDNDGMEETKVSYYLYGRNFDGTPIITKLSDFRVLSSLDNLLRKNCNQHHSFVTIPKDYKRWEYALNSITWNQNQDKQPAWDELKKVEEKITIPILIKQGNTYFLYDRNGEVPQLKQLEDKDIKDLNFTVGKTQLSQTSPLLKHLVLDNENAKNLLGIVLEEQHLHAHLSTASELLTLRLNTLIKKYKEKYKEVPNQENSYQNEREAINKLEAEYEKSVNQLSQSKEKLNDEINQNKLEADIVPVAEQNAPVDESNLGAKAEMEKIEEVKKVEKIPLPDIHPDVKMEDLDENGKLKILGDKGKLLSIEDFKKKLDSVPIYIPQFIYEKDKRKKDKALVPYGVKIGNYYYRVSHPLDEEKGVYLAQIVTSTDDNDINLSKWVILKHPNPIRRDIEREQETLSEFMLSKGLMKFDISQRKSELKSIILQPSENKIQRKALQKQKAECRAELNKLSDLETKFSGMWFDMQLAPGFDVISNNNVSNLFNKNFSTYNFLAFVKAYISAAKKLIDKGYAHRDLKGYNALYNPLTQKLTLIDFDLAIPFGVAANEPIECKYLPGTHAYNAPELIIDALRKKTFKDGIPVYDEKTEIFNLTLAIAHALKLVKKERLDRAASELAAKEIFIASEKIKEVRAKYTTQEDFEKNYPLRLRLLEEKELEENHEIPLKYRRQLLQIFRRMTAEKPEQRITMQEALNQVQQLLDSCSMTRSRLQRIGTVDINELVNKKGKFIASKKLLTSLKLMHQIYILDPERRSEQKTFNINKIIHELNKKGVIVAGVLDAEIPTAQTHVRSNSQVQAPRSEDSPIVMFIENENKQQNIDAIRAHIHFTTKSSRKEIPHTHYPQLHILPVNEEMASKAIKNKLETTRITEDQFKMLIKSLREEYMFSLVRSKNIYFMVDPTESAEFKTMQEQLEAANKLYLKAKEELDSAEKSHISGNGTITIYTQKLKEFEKCNANVAAKEEEIKNYVAKKKQEIIDNGDILIIKKKVNDTERFVIGFANSNNQYIERTIDNSHKALVENLQKKKFDNNIYTGRRLYSQLSEAMLLGNDTLISNKKPQNAQFGKMQYSQRAEEIKKTMSDLQTSFATNLLTFGAVSVRLHALEEQMVHTNRVKYALANTFFGKTNHSTVTRHNLEKIEQQIVSSAIAPPAA